MAEVILDIKTQIAEARKGIDQVNKGMKDMGEEGKKANQKVQQEMTKTSRIAEDLRGTMASVFAVGTVISLAKGIINVRVEFEKFEAMLKVALGSAEAASKEFSKIQDFASRTPYSVRELTDSFVKLVNFGFKPTQKQMKAMGDLSAALGKDFMQLTEAIIDAQTGEFERLKEFGIRASKQGDQVSLTFKGITQQVEFNADAIRNAIVAYGEMEGVQGTMEEISKTLGGQISNLGDSIQLLANNIGEMGSGEVANGITALKSVVDIVTRLTELKPELSADTGVLGFLSKVSEGIKTYFGIVLGPATSAGRELFAKTLEGISESLNEVADSTENAIDNAEDDNETTEIQITTINSLNEKIKELTKLKNELNVNDLAGIEAKNKEIAAIKEQITQLNKLGEALEIAKVKKIEIADLDIDEEGIFGAPTKEALEEGKARGAELSEAITKKQEEEAAKQSAAALAQEELQKQLYEGRIEAANAAFTAISAFAGDNARAQQIINIAQAVMNGALGITKTAAELGYPAAIPFQIALALQTLAQIATIREQKFARGHYEVLAGDRHAHGGVNIGVGEAEQGEGLAVFSRAATQKYGKFLPAFVKAINENDGEFGYSDGAYMISFDDSKSVKELKDINKALNKPTVRYEKGYRIETRKGQTTRVKI